ncbi:MAG TPA: hypothetical protein VHR66_27915 [Gemmataceae bacterium]|jgi:Skp family chaperone for outer membrane proteins|nr:hypothetical protein [Gemmataceae bacterium]
MSDSERKDEKKKPCLTTRLVKGVVTRPQSDGKAIGQAGLVALGICNTPLVATAGGAVLATTLAIDAIAGTSRGIGRLFAWRRTKIDDKARAKAYALAKELEAQQLALNEIETKLAKQIEDTAAATAAAQQRWLEFQQQQQAEEEERQQASAELQAELNKPTIEELYDMEQGEHRRRIALIRKSGLPDDLLNGHLIVEVERHEKKLRQIMGSTE